MEIVGKFKGDHIMAVLRMQYEDVKEGSIHYASLRRRLARQTWLHETFEPTRVMTRLTCSVFD